VFGNCRGDGVATLAEGVGQSLRLALEHNDGRNFIKGAVVAAHCHDMPMHWLRIGYSSPELKP